MNTKAYLGETPVDDLTGTPFEGYTPTDWALCYIQSYGGIDGGHHKDWVLDQVARILNGTLVHVTMAKWDNGHTEYRVSTGEPSPAYIRWVEDYCDGEDGPDTYEYSTGIAP